MKSVKLVGIYKQTAGFAYMFERHPQVRLQKYLYPDASQCLSRLSKLIWKTGVKLKAAVTQNIDSLHDMAGSKKGSQLVAVQIGITVWCQRFYDLDGFMALHSIIPHCLDCGGIVQAWASMKALG